MNTVAGQPATLEEQVFVAKPITYEKISKNGKRTLISRVMWIDKHGPIPNGKEIRHKCDNPLCINPEHLEIGTHYENMQDMVKRGRCKGSHPGSENPSAKLTESDVLKIIKMRKNGKLLIELAKKYNVSLSCIKRIINGKSWKHIQLKGEA